MDIHYLFSAARRSQDIKQKALAKAVNKKAASLSQFENDVSSLSRETLLAIAPHLNINPGYIKGKSKNPFKSSSIIFAHLVSRSDIGPFVNVETQLFPLFAIIEANDKIQFTTVYPEADNMLRNTYPPPQPRALIVKDESNNIFVLGEKKSERLEFMKGDNLRATLSLLFTHKYSEKMRGFYFKESTISDELYNRLRQKNVNRKEVLSIIKTATYPKDIGPITDDEKFIFDNIREKNIDAAEIVNFINRTTKWRLKTHTNN
jgi:transcriptional regulator with XRE-family HTH domain